MATPLDAKDELKVLLTQYEQAWSDKRNYDQMIWQTPAISLAIVVILFSGLLTLFSRSENWHVATIIGITALGVAIVGVVQLRKHRFFQMAAIADLRYLQRGLRKRVPRAQPIKITTQAIRRDRSRYHDVPVTWLDRRGAYNWLFWLMCIVALGLLAFNIFAVGHLVKP